jgi:arginine utilization protein RocB
MSTSYDDCQDIEKERTRDEREGEIRQRLLGPIGQRPQVQARTPLLELARKCVCAKAQEIQDNAEFADDTSKDYWLVSYELMSELEDLLDDLKTIEQEGW